MRSSVTSSLGSRGGRTGASFWGFVREKREKKAPPETEQEPFGAEKQDTGVCWEWQGSRDLCGYGRFSMGGRTVLAHRYAWELVNGPIPKGLVIWHACGNFACVWPDHLEALPRSEQRLRSKRATTPERFWQRVEKLPDPSHPTTAQSPSETKSSTEATQATDERIARTAQEQAEGLGGCWIWQGSISPWGYGQIALRGKHATAHRYAYTITYGPLPDEVKLLHCCGNPRCVRPDHLMPATRKDISQHRWQAVTHCAHGHPRAPENLYTTPKGVQLCRLCHNDRMRRYQAKRREQLRATEAEATRATTEMATA